MKREFDPTKAIAWVIIVGATGLVWYLIIRFALTVLRWRGEA